MYPSDWWEVHLQDFELHALLSVAIACRWLWDGDVDRLTDFREMLEEVSDAQRPVNEEKVRILC